MDSTRANSTDFSHPAFRFLVSICIGSVAATYCFVVLTAQNSARSAADFTWHWLAARALLDGLDPYLVVKVGGEYDLIAPYIYPLTTAIGSIPFAAWLEPIPATASFIGVSSTLLAWAVTSEGYQRLPLFLSVPFLWAANSGQFSPILTAGALIPALGWLAPLKPTLGLATIAYRPSLTALAGSAIFVGVAFVVNPWWLQGWYASLAQRVEDSYWVPLTVVGGPVMLLALTRWRRPEARLLLVLSLVPQLFFFYDQLLLWLVPKTWKESSLLSGLSWIALIVGNTRITTPAATTHDVSEAYAPVVFAFLFLPALVMILVRRNEDSSNR